MTADADRVALLRIARDAITAHVTGARPTDSTTDDAWPFGGAFVTLHHRGELRGCIGHIDADRPLARVIRDCAVSACSRDPRFPPVNASELADLAIELSLLGPLERITGTDEVNVGRHGLVVAREGRRGLLLPQVAVEWGWDAATFVAQTCRKAGLAHDAWRHGAALWRFDAEVFGELLA